MTQQPPDAAEEPSVLDEIAPISGQPRHIKILIYGPPGAGKTVLAGTANRGSTGPALFADCEAGTLSLKDNVDAIQITSLKRLGDLLRFLRDGQHQYRTVVLDSLSEMQKVVMQQVIRQAVKEDPSHDKDLPYQKDWYRNSELVRRIVRSFRDLPMNVVFTALAKERQNEQDGSIRILPLLPGQLAEEVPAYVDVVGYLTVKEVPDPQGKPRIVRRLVVQPVGNVTAKDRSDALGPYIDNAEIPVMVKRMVDARQEALAREAAPEQPVTEKAGPPSEGEIELEG